jgi:carboxymethylenebutenolidase
MIEETIPLGTGTATMETFVTRPDEKRQYPLVLFLMDALGIREELRDMCRRIASVGYLVVLPNLYYRNGGPSFDPSTLSRGWVDPRMEALNDALTMKHTVADCEAVLDWARQRNDVQWPGAVIGYCMGGRHAIAAAAAFPQAFAAMASMHGGRLVSDAPDAPHRRIRQMQAEAYFAWADNDPVAPLAHAQVIESELAARGRPYRLEHHIGALHGFTFPERYCHHKAAAETVWCRLFSLFRRNLPAPT